MCGVSSVRGVGLFSMYRMPAIAVVPCSNIGGDKFLGARCEMWPIRNSEYCQVNFVSVIEFCFQILTVLFVWALTPRRV